MRTADSAVSTFLASSNVAAAADLWRFSCSDGNTYYATSFDTPIIASGNTYGTGLVLTRGSLQQSLDLSVDQMTVVLDGNYTLANNKTVYRSAVDGYFDECRVELDRLLMPSPGDTSLPPISKWYTGKVAGITPNGREVTLTIMSKLYDLNVSIPQFHYSLGCSNCVYDAGCGLNRASFTTAYTCTTGSTTQQAVVTLGAAADYYKGGVIRFAGNVTPALANVRRTVRSNGTGASAVVTLSTALPVAPAAGDTVYMYPGCDRTRTTCVSTFSNLAHWRAFPHIPADGDE